MCPRDAKCCSASNMVICPLGTEKKYIIHVSTDPQIALNTGMCKISIVNIKKRQLLTPQPRNTEAPCT